MINILKPFVVWGTALKQDKFRLTTLTLTFFYVSSTAFILTVSSVAVLILFAPPETELPFRAEVPMVEIEHSEWSFYEIREHLATVIVLVDMVVLFFVSLLSYYFARRTLSPIKRMHETQIQFMGDVAHELRTPLSVIQVGIGTILKKQRTISEYEAFITDMQEETQRLTRLSNQLLRLLKTEDVTRNTLTEVDVSRVSETELWRFEAYAQERCVAVVGNISQNIRLYTDPDSFVEIMQNILKNAIDYNTRGGVVTVTLTERESDVCLEIADTGIGISHNAQAGIFNRFVKGDSARTQTTGSGAGLGLSIVRGLVIKLGGRIALKSELAVGTTITITFPKLHS